MLIDTSEKTAVLHQATDKTQAPEIGYILKAFPRTSETFITNEIYLLEKLGVNLSLFSVKTLRNQQTHAVISRIRASVTYLPEAEDLGEDFFPVWLLRNAPKFLGAHAHLFRLRPLTYLRTLLEAMGMCLEYRDSFFSPPRKIFLKEFLQAGFIARQVIEAATIRHLHAHFCHGVTTIAMFASRLSGLPFSFTAHAKDIYLPELNPGDLLQRKMQRAKFIVTCTEANHAHLESLRPKDPSIKTAPIHRIYHGLSTELFTAESKAHRTSAAPLILSVGRIVEKKGFTWLIEACRLLCDRGYEFKCRIVGGTDTYSHVVEQRIRELHLEDIVELQTAVTQEELRGIYQQSTVFALPCCIVENGDRDGIPNVLVEAMAMKLPVVSTDISGIPELVSSEINGLLVPPRDAATLAAAIERLLNDEALRNRLGKSARATVCEHFDAERNTVELKNLFSSCLK